jgi:hypothetical protein
MSHFFFDRNISPRMASIIDIFDRDNTIIHHDQRFDPSTPDEDWLGAITQYDPVPVVVSGDARILTDPAQSQVLRGLSITFFALERGWLSLKWHDYAWKFVKVWPRIAGAATPRRPSVYRVPVSTTKVDYYCLTSELGFRKHR